MSEQQKEQQKKSPFIGGEVTHTIPESNLWDAVEITWRPPCWEEFAKEQTRQFRNLTDTKGSAEFLARHIVRWSISEPPTAENIQRLHGRLADAMLSLVLFGLGMSKN